MKSTLSLVTGLLITVLNTFANSPSDKPKAAFISQCDAVKVFYKGSVPENVTVAIFDAFNNKVFSETLPQVMGFTRPYKINNLQDGSYLLKVLVGKKEINHFVIVKGEKEPSMNVTKTLNAQSLTHLTRLTNGKYLLTIPASEQGKVGVRIFQEEEKLIYNHTLTVKGDTAVVMNVDKLSGKFIMEVSSVDKIKSYFSIENP